MPGTVFIVVTTFNSSFRGLDFLLSTKDFLVSAPPGVLFLPGSLGGCQSCQGGSKGLQMLSAGATGGQDTSHAKELAKLASAVVPLQRLNIKEDTYVIVPCCTSEPKLPVKPQQPRE